MPIDSPHPEYKKHVSLWTRCRDAVEGQEAIKEAGAIYLPPLTAHVDQGTDGAKAYSAYLGRALWFGATDRTLNGYVGAIMRTDPVFVVPSGIQERLDDVTAAGQTAVQFVHSMTKELLTTGRLGLLVDKDDGEELPYVKLYYPENILNWIVEKGKLVAVTLQECVLEAKDPMDPYFQEEHVQIRELLVVDGVYIARLHKKINDQWQTFDATTPVKRGEALDSIPFVLISADEDAYGCSKPPIMDLVNANVNHYQLDADYRHGLHFTALPTAVFTGVDDDRTYYLGSEGAINLRNENSKAFFLEFQGLGLTAIKDAMEERKAQMASLGAQLIQRGQRGRGVETAESARIQHSGETSLLATIVGRAEEGFEKALEFVAAWAGVTGEVEVNINRDFIDAALNAEEISALVMSWQGGAISPEVLFWNLQRGGVIDPKKSYDEFVSELGAEKSRRQADAVALAAATTAATPTPASQGGAGDAAAHKAPPTGGMGTVDPGAGGTHKEKE